MVADAKNETDPTPTQAGVFAGVASQAPPASPAQPFMTSQSRARNAAKAAGAKPMTVAIEITAPDPTPAWVKRMMKIAGMKGQINGTP